MLRARRTRGSGGTGRRARLRGVWFTPYGFKSRFPHHKKSDHICDRLFYCAETGAVDNPTAAGGTGALAKQGRVVSNQRLRRLFNRPVSAGRRQIG